MGNHMSRETLYIVATVMVFSSVNIITSLMSPEDPMAVWFRVLSLVSLGVGVFVVFLTSSSSEDD